MQLFFFSALLAAVSANVSSSSSSSSSSAILPSPSKASSATSFLDALHTVPLVSEDRSLRLLAMLAADSKVTKSVEGLDGFKSSHSFRIQERAAKNVLSQLQHRQVEEEDPAYVKDLQLALSQAIIHHSQCRIAHHSVRIKRLAAKLRAWTVNNQQSRQRGSPTLLSKGDDDETIVAHIIISRNRLILDINRLRIQGIDPSTALQPLSKDQIAVLTSRKGSSLTATATDDISTAVMDYSVYTEKFRWINALESYKHQKLPTASELAERERILLAAWPSLSTIIKGVVDASLHSSLALQDEDTVQRERSRKKARMGENESKEGGSQAPILVSNLSTLSSSTSPSSTSSTSSSLSFEGDKFKTDANLFQMWIDVTKSASAIYRKRLVQTKTGAWNEDSASTQHLDTVVRINCYSTDLTLNAVRYIRAQAQLVAPRRSNATLTVPAFLTLRQEILSHDIVRFRMNVLFNAVSMHSLLWIEQMDVVDRRISAVRHASRSGPSSQQRECIANLKQERETIESRGKVREQVVLAVGVYKDLYDDLRLGYPYEKELKQAEMQLVSVFPSWEQSTDEWISKALASMIALR